MVLKQLLVQNEKTDAGQEDEASQPGRRLPHQAPADEVGDPDLPQGHPQQRQAGHPVGDPKNLVGQQVEPVKEVGLVQVRDAVERGGQPGARGQHLLGE